MNRERIAKEAYEKYSNNPDAAAQAVINSKLRIKDIKRLLKARKFDKETIKQVIDEVKKARSERRGA